MDYRKTKQYYENLKPEEICDCDYCTNYIQRIKQAYPELSKYLGGLGINIEKPFETMPLEPKNGYIDYISIQYVVLGSIDDFLDSKIESVSIDIADTHPSTSIEEEHYIIEIYPIRLKWIAN